MSIQIRLLPVVFLLPPPPRHTLFAQIVGCYPDRQLLLGTAHGRHVARRRRYRA